MATIGLNLPGDNVARRMDAFTKKLGSAQEALGSGLRVSKPSVDPASAALGIKFASDISTLEQANRNATGMDSVLTTAVAAMDKVVSLLTQMKDIAVQARSGLLSDTERGYLDNVYQELKAQVTSIGTDTQWNGANLLDSTYTSTTQVGLGSTNTITIAITQDVGALTAIAAGDVGTEATATTAVGALDADIATMLGVIASAAASQTRLGAISDNLVTQIDAQKAGKESMVGADVNKTLSDVTTLKAQVQVSQQMFLSTLEQQTNLAQMVQTARA